MSLDSKWILVLGNMLIQTLPTTLGDEPTAKNTAFTEAFALSRLELISCLDLLFVAQSEVVSIAKEVALGNCVA